MRHWLLVALHTALLCLTTTPAIAQEEDEEDFEFEDEEGSGSEEESKDEEEQEEEAPIEEEDDEFIFEDEVPPEGEKREDLLEDEGSTEDDVLAPGTDTAEIYKAKQAQLAKLAADEEVMAWEAYLEEYPNSIFRERIEGRIDDLVQAQFRMRVDEEGGSGDADKQQLLLVHPLHLPNLNPRTRIQLGFEFGFPGFTVGAADFEYAILRNVSVHGGVHGRYQGWGLEVGTRYAFVKSTRLQLVATAMVDLRLNFNPLFFMVRPQLGVGKIIGPAQILLTFGAEIETRTSASVALIGGAHVGVRLAPPVALFVETDFHLRALGRDAGLFAFDTVAFGFRFFPGFKKRQDDPLEIHAAGHVPAASRYLSYYQGAVQAQGIYYLKDRQPRAR